MKHECCPNAIGHLFADNGVGPTWLLDMGHASVAVTHCPWCGAELGTAGPPGTAGLTWAELAAGIDAARALRPPLLAEQATCPHCSGRGRIARELRCMSGTPREHTIIEGVDDCAACHGTGDSRATSAFWQAPR